MPWSSRAGPREPRAAPATPRVETYGHPSAASENGPTVLDRMGPDVAELARGARVCAARHVVRRHRDWLRRRWRRRSARRRPSRPSIDTAIRTFVNRIAAANRLWGAPRIHGELGKLGVGISERTVSRLLRRSPRPPSQTWRIFFTNHVATLVSIDFFTVPTLTGRVLFVFVLLAHHRRRVVYVNVTEHPTAAWTAQQMKRFRTTRRHDGC